ncbi:MAG: hypothetical protein EOP06_06300 [Proteobacteria bacterium]|nr:MAG: hypothetical protein EOP06_06300 [Pseudomonadota bacterium]
MNPAADFNRAVRTIWSSDRSPQEKRIRLNDVHAAIEHYVEKMDARRDALVKDPEAGLAYDRVKAYLVKLASDVEALAIKCGSPSAAR